MRCFSIVPLVSLALAASACGREAPKRDRSFDPGPTPGAYLAGEALYTAACARCHGPQGTGTDQGPPFVDRIYEPNHHADASFHRAVQLGVVPHHWKFGPMPPIEGLTSDQVDQIISYVRWLQRQAGIF